MAGLTKEQRAAKLEAGVESSEADDTKDPSRLTVENSLKELGIEYSDHDTFEELISKLSFKAKNEEDRIKDRKARMVEDSVKNFAKHSNISSEKLKANFIKWGIPEDYLNPWYVLRDNMKVADYIFNDGDENLTKLACWEKIRRSGKSHINVNKSVQKCQLHSESRARALGLIA